MACRLEFTTNELRCVVFALHPDVAARGFTTSVNWLNVFMRETMQLPMRRVGTTKVPQSLSDVSLLKKGPFSFALRTLLIATKSYAPWC